MNENVSAKKLSLYFGIVIMLFALIISIIFMFLFYNQTIDVQTQSLINRAEIIADEFSEFENNGEKMQGYGAYLRFINSIAGAEAWIVDRQQNVLTSGNGGMGKGTGNRGDSESIKQELPENAQNIVDKIFEGEINVGESFSDIMHERTITVGVPVYNEKNEITLVVLLHTQISEIQGAAKRGISILIVSILIGIILSFILSVFLSKKFTGPILLEEAQNIIQQEQNRKDFLASVAHELKTPLTIVKTSLENLQSRDNLTEDEMRQSSLQSLMEINYLQRFVNDLLDLSKLENPGFSIDICDVYLSELISDITRSVRRMAEEKDIAIIIKDIPNVSIQGDYERLRQMFFIILDNAIKFSGSGSSVTIAGEGSRISVCDEGSGISEEELPHIFDRFYRNEEKENRSGTGLGLAIAKEIAERHKISLKVKSKENIGTCFYLDFSKLI
ncbi:sensor histidine kinase [Anaerosphaera multitolerans]|uniref:histidine kinase n=1 Tax=Anaerosphaera multitolerans TaxID=2487351 RepID=A0A437S7F5_9FIRM|nr:HAMP domain-containing sensor histidine kinase [Anaerosphaera multitolerans]RVU54986.1 hypothetical protein EF514_05225 [Anaerosphaera multitolerans]